MRRNDRLEDSGRARRAGSHFEDIVSDFEQLQTHLEIGARRIHSYRERGPRSGSRVHSPGEGDRR